MDVTKSLVHSRELTDSGQESNDIVIVQKTHINEEPVPLRQSVDTLVDFESTVNEEMGAITVADEHLDVPVVDDRQEDLSVVEEPMDVTQSSPSNASVSNTVPTSVSPGVSLVVVSESQEGDGMKQSAPPHPSPVQNPSNDTQDHPHPPAVISYSPSPSFDPLMVESCPALPTGASGSTTAGGRPLSAVEMMAGAVSSGNISPASQGQHFAAFN